MDYDNKNSGVLFKNDKKDNDKQPDYKGTFTNDQDVEMDLAAWIRTSKRGLQFLSVKVSDKWVSDNADVTPEQSQADNKSFDDPIPF
jgi:uncharacterized protein (DUF736 family)